MIYSLSKLIDYSGDSQLLGFAYKNGILIVTLENEELDKEVELRISTERICTNKSPKKDDVFNNCRLELIELENVLDSENGYWVPGKQFSQLMKEAKQDLFLAYGMKVSDAKYILSLKGYSNLLSCLVEDSSKITFVLKN